MTLTANLQVIQDYSGIRDIFVIDTRDLAGHSLRVEEAAKASDLTCNITEPQVKLYLTPSQS
jgi:hypothetical protein